MGRKVQTMFVPMMPVGGHVGTPMEELLFDIFGQNAANSSACHHHVAPFMMIDPFTAMFGPCQRRFSRPVRQWFRTLDMAGFGSKDITVKMEGDAAKITAKREVKNGEDIDRIERVRSVKIPEGVDTQNLSCLLGKDGTFIMKAPYKVTEDKQKTSKCCDSSCEKTCQKQPECCKKDSSETPVQTEQPPQNTESHVSNESGQTSEDKKQFTENAEETTIPVSSECSSRCQSPTVSEDFDIIQNGETGSSERPETDTNGDENDGKDTADIIAAHLEVMVPEMTSSVVERDGKKFHEISVNMDGFPMDTISIRFKDNAIHLHASMDSETDGLFKRREAHRVFSVPENSMAEEAKAAMNDKGILTISVPLTGDEMKDGVKEIPIATESQ